MRIFKKTIIILLSSVLFLALTSVLLVFIFEDDIKQYAVDYLNEQVDADIRIEQVDLSFYSKFPYASLHFKNVVIKDSKFEEDLNDTLMYTKDLYLEFNLLDVLSGDYTVRKIEAENARFKLKIGENGEENYDILKEDKDSKESDKFDFALEDVSIKNATIHYINEATDQDYLFTSKKLNLAGAFSEKDFTLKANSEFFIHHFKDREVNLVQEKSAKLDLDLKVDHDSATYAINKGKLRIEDLLFDVSGYVQDVDSSTYCDLHILGADMPLTSIFSIFPEQFFEKMKGYSSKGILKFDTHIKGNVSNTEPPLIVAEFEIENGELTEEIDNVTLTKLHFAGNFTNKGKDNTEQLVVHEFSAQLKDGHFDGKGTVTNFENPHLDIKLNGDMNLATFQQFARIESIEEIKGGVTFKSSFNGKMKNLSDFDKKDLKIVKASGKVHFKNVDLKLRDNHNEYSNVNGTFVLKNRDAVMKGLTGNVSGSKVEMSGAFKNFLPYLLLNNQKLNIVADLKSDYIALDAILYDKVESAPKAAKAKNGKKTSTPYTLMFPSDINFNLDARVGKLVFDQFTATSIKGNVKLIDRKLKTKRLSFKSAGGTCKGSLEIDGTKKGIFLITTSLKLNKMKVSELFRQFDDFGQEYITNKHLGGELIADVEFGAVMNDELIFDQDKIRSVVDISIKNGELKEFDPLLDIAAYMRDDPVIKRILKDDVDELEKQLRHIKFSELNNRIEIKDRTIHIPAMEIQSNVMALNVAGRHTFDNKIDYNLNFRFRDLKQADESEFGIVVDDQLGLRIFMKMTGTTENPEYSRDNIGRKEYIKKDIEEEKENIKAILKEEFGLFKKDSTLKQRETPKEEVEFLLYGDDFNIPEEEEGVKPKKHRKEDKPTEKRINRLFDKLGIKVEEEKKEIEMQIEDDNF
jgi:hypothetical protein